MDIKSDKITMVDASSLEYHPKNMNEHSDEQIDRLIKLIEYQGWRIPVIVESGSNLVVAGNGRLQAARKMGVDKIPVSYQSFENEDQLYAFMASDNAIASWASLDLDKINLEIKDFSKDFDIELLGLKDFEVKEIELPDLGDGADSMIKKVTLTLSTEQADFLDEAIKNSKKEFDCSDEINDNTNGNAVAALCKNYINGTINVS